MKRHNVWAAVAISTALLAYTSIAQARLAQPMDGPDQEYPFAQALAPASKLSLVQQARMKQIFDALADDRAEADAFVRRPDMCSFPTPESDARNELVKKRIAKDATEFHAIGSNAIPDLVHGMYHRSLSVQSMCAQALTQYGKQSVPSIIWGCKYYGVKSTAIVKAFQNIGPPAYDALTEAYDDVTSGLKETAVESLGAIAYKINNESDVGKTVSEPSPANLSIIRRMLSDPSESIRSSSLTTLSEIGNDTASLEAIEKLATDENQKIFLRSSAIGAMEVIAIHNKPLVAPAKKILKKCMNTLNDASLRKFAEEVWNNINVDEFLKDNPLNLGRDSDDVKSFQSSLRRLS